MTARLSVLVAARDEEQRIGETIEALRMPFPDATIVVADDGSRDGTAVVAEQAGARVIRLGRRGKGQALTMAEKQLAPGPLLLCDADLRGDVRRLAETDADLAIAVFRTSEGGGFGLAKGVARALIRLRCGRVPEEPLSGQRWLSAAARAEVFPVAMGFGVETRMTIDAVRAGLEVEEIELRSSTAGRDVTCVASHTVAASSPSSCSHAGLRP